MLRGALDLAARRARRRVGQTAGDRARPATGRVGGALLDRALARPWQEAGVGRVEAGTGFRDARGAMDVLPVVHRGRAAVVARAVGCHLLPRGQRLGSVGIICGAVREGARHAREQHPCAQSRNCEVPHTRPPSAVRAFMLTGPSGRQGRKRGSRGPRRIRCCMGPMRRAAGAGRRHACWSPYLSCRIAQGDEGDQEGETESEPPECQQLTPSD